MQSSVSLRLYLGLSGAVFFLVGVLHLLRLLNQWQVVVGTHAVPPALSWVGLPVATGYAVWALYLLRRR